MINHRLHIWPEQPALIHPLGEMPHDAVSIFADTLANDPEYFS
jgi:hypothetical protein